MTGVPPGAGLKSEARSPGIKKAPSTKLQPPEKLQNSNNHRRFGDGLELGGWRFSGAWMLEFGCFCVLSFFRISRIRISNFGQQAGGQNL